MGGGDVSTREYARAAKHVYAYSHTGGDFQARHATRREVRGLRELRRQARRPGQARKRFRHVRAQWRFHRRIDRVTVYGKWSIPWYVVACESGGSWGAYNPSGAAGPYQVMPEWGRPWPADSVATMAEHHVIAARIWAGGSGASNWVCA